MSCFANTKTKSSSDYTEKIKNVEMMKSAKTSKNPTINYKLKGSEFEQFINYETFLSLVKAYTDMRFIVCGDCKCKSKPPSSIVEGTSSYHCGDTLYPYGKYVNQGIESDECFKFPRKITNDPCIPETPCPPCPPPCPEPCKYEPIFTGMRPCCIKQTKPKCNPCERLCERPIGNPLLKCPNPCR